MKYFGNVFFLAFLTIFSASAMEIDKGVVYIKDLVKNLSEEKSAVKDNSQLIKNTALLFAELPKISTPITFSKQDQQLLIDTLTQLHKKLEVVFSEKIVDKSVIDQLKNLTFAAGKRFIGISEQISNLLSLTAKITAATLRPAPTTATDEGVAYLKDLAQDLSTEETSFNNNVHLIRSTALFFPYLIKIPKGSLFSKSNQELLLDSLYQLRNKLEVVFSDNQIALHIELIVTENCIDQLKNLIIAIGARFIGIKGVNQNIESQITYLLNLTSRASEYFQSARIR